MSRKGGASYSEQLQDKRWQQKRLQIFERDKWRCLNPRCHRTSQTLHVHHGAYLRGVAPWDHPDEVLWTLCADCHEAAEQARAALYRQLGELPPWTLGALVADALGGDAATPEDLILDPASRALFAAKFPRDGTPLPPGLDSAAGRLLLRWRALQCEVAARLAPALERGDTARLEALLAELGRILVDLQSKRRGEG